MATLHRIIRLCGPSGDFANRTPDFVVEAETVRRNDDICAALLAQNRGIVVGSQVSFPGPGDSRVFGRVEKISRESFMTIPGPVVVTVQSEHNWSVHLDILQLEPE